MSIRTPRHGARPGTEWAHLADAPAEVGGIALVRSDAPGSWSALYSVVLDGEPVGFVARDLKASPVTCKSGGYQRGSGVRWVPLDLDGRRIGWEETKRRDAVAVVTRRARKAVSS